MSRTSPPPTCAECGLNDAVRRTTGEEIYPHRRDLYHRQFFECYRDGAYVGCHAGTAEAFGTPAGPHLRKARGTLHDQRVDPLWKPFAQPEQSAMRNIVYAYMGREMGLPPELTHIAMFDLEQCRAAWRAFNKVSVESLLEWAKKNPGLTHARIANPVLRDS